MNIPIDVIKAEIETKHRLHSRSLRLVVVLKKKFYVLENSLALIQQQIGIYGGLTFFFKNLCNANRSTFNSVDAIKDDKEAVRFFKILDNLNRDSFYQFNESNAFSGLIQELAAHLNKFAKLFHDFYRKCLHLKEIFALSKYFSELDAKDRELGFTRKHFYERHILKLIEKLRVQELNGGEQVERLAWLCDRAILKVAINKNYAEYKSMPGSQREEDDFSRFLNHFDITTYQRVYETIKKFHNDKYFESIIKFYLNCLIRDYSERVDQIRINLDRVDNFYESGKN